MTKFATKTSKVMVQEEINVQSLTENKDIQVGYSDSDIVIIDSIQKFAEINTAHVSMHAIVICVKGKVQGLMNGLPMELHENQVAIVPPNVMITSIMVSPDFNLKAMFFTNSILQSFLREKMNIWNEVMYVHRLHILTIEKREDMLFFTHFYEMLSLFIERGGDNPYSTDIIQSLLRAAVLALCAKLKEKLPAKEISYDSHTGNNHFQRFLDLLSNSSTKHRTVASYADELCISPKYLSAICKKNSDKTATEWIREHVLEDIRYYLRQTDLSIKQVSDELQFPNPSFFGKYVKEHFGMTPSQLRNSAAPLPSQ